MKRAVAVRASRQLCVGLLLLAAGLTSTAAQATTTTLTAEPPLGSTPPPAADADASPAVADAPAVDAPALAPAPASRFHLGIELDSNFRDSADNKFAYHYPFQPGLPVNGVQETVDPGSHFEVSNVALLMDYDASPLWQAHLRFNAINLYYRNPTSSDHKYDLAEAWVIFGRDAAPAIVPAHPGVYVKVGKFERPERQTDRHLQSYGLAGTAFELFEDAGVEVGTDLGRHFLAKVAFTQGNPLFVRDANALAGDEADILSGDGAARLAGGSTLLYDSHVERLDFSHPEYAGYLGWRAGNDGGTTGVELLLWGRRRRLATAEELPGSPYPGDLAVLGGPAPGGAGPPLLPFEGNGKQEAGLNVWIYHQSGLSVYGQVVDQKIAGLGRVGVETEVAWRLDLPLVLAAGGHQLFSYVAPAVRFSKLHNRFPNLRPTPEPSLAWDWEKYDGGLRFGLWNQIDLTVEYSYNRIFLDPELFQTENELLATLRLRL
jgi:hypothetical protein